MNNLNLSDEKANALLKLAAQKLGKDPAELKSQLQSGSLDSLTKNMSPAASKKFQALMSNPKAAEALLGDPRVQGMIANMFAKK